MSKEAKDAPVQEFLSGVGLDVGTANIVVCRQKKEGTFLTKHHRNLLLELDVSEEAEDLLKRGDYMYVKSDNKYFIVGEDALKLANAMNSTNIIRPMKLGLINPSLKKSQDMLFYILKAVLGEPLMKGEHLRFSVPANPVDKPDTNNVFHEMVIKSYLDKLGFSSKSLNEALANLYSETPSMDVEGEGTLPMTGLSISCGAGMTNVCFGMKGLAVIKFSITKSGDYIDEQVANVTGVSVSRVIKIKEKDLDLSADQSSDRVLQALSIYYDEFIVRVFSQIAKELTRQNVQVDGPVEVVVCGGTSMPKGFVERVSSVVAQHDIPFKIKSVKLAGSPFFSVSQGCCIAALADTKRTKEKEKEKGE